MSLRKWALLSACLLLLIVTATAFRQTRDDFAFLKTYVVKDETIFYDFSRVSGSKMAFIKERRLTLKGLDDKTLERLLIEHFVKKKGWVQTLPRQFQHTDPRREPGPGDEGLDFYFGSNGETRLDFGRIMTKFDVWWARLRGIEFSKAVS